MAHELDKEILEELTSIKKLMIFALLKNAELNVTQSDLANVLGTSQGQISRMLTKPSAKPAAKNKDEPS